MGSITYDFLNNSFLFREQDIDNEYSSYSNSQVEEEIEKYIAFVEKSSEDLESEISSTSELKMFSSSKHQPISFLTQSALYLDQYIIQDPLFELSTRQTKSEEALGSHVGYYPLDVDKHKISLACRYLKTLTPMIAANYLKLFPISRYTRSKWDGRLTLPPTEEMNRILPNDVEDFFWKKVKLNNLKSFGDGKFGIKPSEDFKVSRAIHVSFGDDDFWNGNMYHLTQIEVLPTDEDGKVQIRSYLPDTLPTIESFQNWVTESVNKSAYGVFSNTSKEINLSERLGATYLTDNTLKYDLLTMNTGKPKETIKSFAASSFLNYEVPFIENIEISKLMELKQKDGDAFTNFRIEFQKQIRDLRLVNDPKVFNQKIESIYHEFYEVQVQKVNQKMEQVSRQMKATAAMSIASIVPAVATGGLSLFGLLVAGAKGYQSYDKYYTDAKNNPAFMLWKSKRKN
jgi:hypothetical protein